VVPPYTPHTFATGEDTGVDMLFPMPGTARFEYFRLAERIARGEASPEEFVRTQDRFDNHLRDSEVWREFLAATSISPLTAEGQRQ
jgi:hypothetical protein